jgi:hypothetical protein
MVNELLVIREDELGSFIIIFMLESKVIRGDSWYVQVYG